MSDFLKTNWDVVADTRSSRSEESRAAISELCRSYWTPVYAYLRRSGLDHDDATDATQEFFLVFVEKNLAARADARRGRFRNYLLTCVRHFLRDRHVRETAGKRRPPGGLTSLDVTLDDDHRSLLERVASTAPSPEQAFETAWARTTFRQALERLRDGEAARRDPARFDLLLRHCLDESPPTVRESARRLGISEPALKMGVSRLRRSIAVAVEQEIASQTPTSARTRGVVPDANDEARAVLRAVASSPR